MDQNRFADLTRVLISMPSRRHLLRGMVGAGLGLRVARLPKTAEAKTKRKKVKRNAFGCVDVGGYCQDAAQCCSGICEGKNGKRKCRAHDGGTGCRAGLIEFGCADGVEDVVCTTSTGQPGICNTTTGNAAYCVAAASCPAVPCKKDAECRDRGGTAAACIQCNGCLGGTACAGPSNGDCAPK